MDTVCKSKPNPSDSPPPFTHLKLNLYLNPFQLKFVADFFKSFGAKRGLEKFKVVARSYKATSHFKNSQSKSV